MSWFSQRWRTQRNAILKVNCRIPWIFMFLNACCASGYSWKHACLSVCSPHSLFLRSSPSERNTRTLGLGGLVSSLILSPSCSQVERRRRLIQLNVSAFSINQCGDMSLRRNKILTGSWTLVFWDLRIVRPFGISLFGGVPKRTQLSDLKSGKRTRWI